MPKCCGCNTDIPHEGACDPCIAADALRRKKESALQKMEVVWELGRMVSPSNTRLDKDGYRYHKHDKDRAQANLSTIEKLRTGDHKWNVYLWGDSGTGKTYLAYLLAEKAFRERGTVIGFLRCSGFQQMAFNRTDEYNRLLGCNLLVIDDIDKLQTFDNSLLFMHEFMDIVRSRLIITANCSAVELTEALLGGKDTPERRKMAIAITSRLQPCSYFEMVGKDLRT